MALIFRLAIVFAFVLLVSLGFAALAFSWAALALFARIVFAVILVVLCGVLAVIVESWSTNEPATEAPPRSE
jgi:hypothetical protein